MTGTTNANELGERLTAYVSEQMGAAVAITSLLPLAGGASRESWAVSLDVAGEAVQMVLRMDTPTTMHDDALSRRQEFEVMAAARDAGVKVANVRYLCDDSGVLGQPFFLMDFVPGISIGRKVIKEPSLAQARERLPEQMAEQLALIHTLPLTERDDLLRPAPGRTPAQETVAQTYAILDRLGMAAPAFEFALRWAERHAPADPDVTYIHGDFRIGNLLVDADGLTAVIDWEFGHLGSPLEEIGYLCMRDWRFGSDHLHAAGLSGRERFIRAYEAASGRTVDRAAVDWWEIVGNIRWGVICLAQAQRHLSGQESSVELASLGRRSAEMQLEALRLIQKVGV